MSNVQQLLKENNLDFTVAKSQVSYTPLISVDKDTEILGDARPLAAFAVHRMDTGAAISSRTVGQNFTVWQNEDCFNLIHNIVGDLNYDIVKMGHLNNGAKMFVQVRIGNDNIGGDAVEKYLNIVNSHDGTSSLYVFPSVFRLRCSNELNGLIKKATSKIAVRHTKNMDQQVQLMMESFKKAVGIIDNAVETFDVLDTISITKEQKINFFKEIVGHGNKDESKRAKSIREQRMTALIDADNMEVNQCDNQTWWQALQAPSYVGTHNNNMHGNNKRMVNSDWLYSNIGGGATLKEKATTIALELAGA